ncbi:peptide/nickel transport system ATP-binding protein [Evansella caseinilytica]|uniref:Peptide/nickel transport system ATP-binding protein n=1 Tax=Evansella caseinilytica TaxID=1503961 RepID=A0A1H3SPA5_9BACI|nr:oligopeptide/dipeptide ABC transporter ATP-binding protein [Evansella caseinilytica]SDZ39754.1 peptide/nickel transport system ATP-binding protein [Evansella caseinilytica]
MKEVLLEAQGLTKHFDVSEGFLKRKKAMLRAVDGVDLTIYTGETLGIVGESGCGKSTLGQLLMRLLEPTRGTLSFTGSDFLALKGEALRQKRADIQIIFQDPFSSLNPRMTVMEIIAEPLKTHRIAKGRERVERVYTLLDAVGLDRSYARRYPHEFSGGQRQRIGIARAIALKPKLIICDEPVSALDVSIQAQILNLMARLQKEFQLTFLFIAHGLPAVKHISDRIAVMYLGKVVELAPKQALFAQPLHPYTEGLIRAVPIPDPAVRDDRERVMLEGELPSPVHPPSGCRFHPRCPYAQASCVTEEPMLTEKESGHFVACHFPLEKTRKDLM